MDVTVVDEHHHFLPGAHIGRDGKPLAVTGPNGAAHIEVPCNDTVVLVVSFLGFDSDTFMVHSSHHDRYEFTLFSHAEQVHEVVVNEHKSSDHLTSSHSELSGKSLQSEGKQTIAKALERIAGVHSIQMGVGVSKPVIRGMSGSRVVFNDAGVRQEGQQWGLDHGIEKDPFTVEHIEVLKGVSGLRYGSGAAGGVINVLPPRLAARNSVEADVSSLYRSNNQSIGLSAGAKVHKKKAFFNVRLSVAEYGDMRVPTDSFTYNRYTLPLVEGRLKNTAGNEKNAFVDVGLVHPHGLHRIMLSTYNLNVGLFAGAVGTPRSYQLTPDGDWRNVDLPNQTVQHNKVTSHQTWYMGKNHQKLQWVTGYQGNHRIERSEPHQHGAGTVTTSDTAVYFLLQTITSNAYLEHRIAGRWSGEVGVDFMYKRNQVEGFEYLIPEYASHNKAVFYLAEGELSERTTVQIGGRLGFYGITSPKTVRRLMLNGEVTDAVRSEALDKSWLNWSISSGVRQKVGKHYELKANLAKSFRNPNIAELAANGVHHGTFRHELGSAQLVPEQSMQTEVTLVRKKSSVWGYQATLFGSYFFNYIYLSPSPFFSPLAEGGQLFSYQQTSAVFAGAEVEATADWNTDWTWHNAFDMVFNQNLETTLPLPFTPPGRYRTFLAYNWQRKQKSFRKLTPKVEVVAVAPQWRVDRNEATTEGYVLLNLRLEAQFAVKNSQITAFAMLQNATNNTYINHLSRYKWLYVPEQGINAVFGVKWALSKKGS